MSIRNSKSWSLATKCKNNTIKDQIFSIQPVHFSAQSCLERDPGGSFSTVLGFGIISLTSGDTSENKGACSSRGYIVMAVTTHFPPA